MKTHFEEALRKRGSVDLSGPSGMDVAMYMSLWYGCLYVVIEAWRELGLRDREVDSLLTSAHADLLRRYRNARLSLPERILAREIYGVPPRGREFRRLGSRNPHRIATLPCGSFEGVRRDLVSRPFLVDAGLVGALDVVVIAPTEQRHGVPEWGRCVGTKSGQHTECCQRGDTEARIATSLSWRY